MQINTKQFQKQFTLLTEQLQDVRVVGQAVFVVIVLLISWSGVKSIQTNYALQKDITGLNQQNELQKLANGNLQLSNDYLESNQYLELSARENFGLAAPGEAVIVVPEVVALSKLSEVSVPSVKKETGPSRERNNYEAWADFFFNRTKINKIDKA